MYIYKIFQYFFIFYMQSTEYFTNLIIFIKKRLHFTKLKQKMILLI